MVKRARQFFQSPAGFVVSIVLILIALWLIIYSVKSNFGPIDSIAHSQSRIFVCSETGKWFELGLEPGMKFPVRSPYSGKNTGYLADETCNWTADGHVDSTTTYILMNKTLGKSGPTFCPTCHRLVVRNNPVARADREPPPTEQEFAAKKLKHVEQSSADR